MMQESKRVSALDPVCGMTVNPESCAGRVRHSGVEYYFCSTHCVDKFRASPDAFLTKTNGLHSIGTQRTPSGPQKRGMEYTCPMHPEVVRTGPGTCPICGMALEPRTV